MSDHVGDPIEPDDRCPCKHCVYARMGAAGIPLGRGLTPAQLAQVVPVFGPSVDPVPAHVTKARAKFDKKISAAEAVVDSALDAFTTADAAWCDAVTSSRTLSGERPILIAADWSRGVSEPEHEAQVAEAKRRIPTTFEQREEAADALRKARVKLQRLVRDQDTAGRIARTDGPSGLGAIAAKLRGAAE